MATEKGLFKDPDKYLPRHQEICEWFLNKKHAEWFIRFEMHDEPIQLQVQFEEPVKSKTDFLYGFCDVVLNYRTTADKQERVIIDAKASSRDRAAVMRQVKTYRDYLPGASRIGIIHGAKLNFDEYRTLSELFESQGFYFSHFDDLKREFKTTTPRLEDKALSRTYDVGGIPRGRRKAVLQWIMHHQFRIPTMYFEFLAEYFDAFYNKTLEDTARTRNLLNDLAQFEQLTQAFDLPFRISDIKESVLLDDPLRCEVLLDYALRSPGEPGCGVVNVQSVFVNGKEIEVGLWPPLPQMC